MLRSFRIFCRSVTDHIYACAHKPQTERFLSQPGTEGVIYISKTWLNDWKKAIPSIVHVPGTLKDLSPQNAEFIGDVRCEHGRLVPTNKTRSTVSLKAATYLKSLFPDWEFMSKEDYQQPCAMCTEVEEAEKQDVKKLKEAALKEKQMMAQLTKIDDTDNLYSSIDYYLLPPVFVQTWKEWVQRPASRKRPEGIDLHDVLCEHGNLSLDLNKSWDEKDAPTVVEKVVWDEFSRCYIGSAPVIVKKATDGALLSVPPQCTSGCIEAALTNFSSTKLKVRLLYSSFDPDNDFPKLDLSYVSCHATTNGTNGHADHDTATIPSSGSGSEEPLWPTSLPTTSENGAKRKTPDSPSLTRRSKRLKVSNGLGGNGTKDLIRKAKVMEVSKEDSLKDIKVKISELFNVPTIYQRVFLRCKELEDNEATVDELGITYEDKLDVMEVEVDEEEALSGRASKGRKGGKKKEEKEGFGGTGLWGYEFKESVECPQCTLINMVQRGEAATCEACEGPLLLEAS
ncbi:hypothetical protein BT69DRAFT_891570 [Atractiella rhizophila]|nr:hypothetical protein BT69DRAFT_891570 [Atractiella rhizophila]